MGILLAFILGVVFCNLFLPLLGFISDAIEAMVSIYITKCGVKINENQVKIKKISAELDDSPVAAIGFHVDSEEEYYDDDDDDFPEEDKFRGRIGF